MDFPLPPRKVTIDRISNAGNPVAKENYQGQCVHVFGAKPGEQVIVELRPKGSHYIGEIVDPTEDQRKLAKQQKKAKGNDPSSGSGTSVGAALRFMSKKTRSLREIGARLPGPIVETQDPAGTQGRNAGRGEKDDGRDKRKEVVHKYD